jgi:hypothetical protein
MREREFDDDDDDESALSQCSEQDPPGLVSSSGDDPEDNQDRQDFIRESAELFESDYDGDKKSKKRLANFIKSDLLQRCMQIEKEEQLQKSQHARPCSMKKIYVRVRRGQCPERFVAGSGHKQETFFSCSDVSAAEQIIAQ